MTLGQDCPQGRQGRRCCDYWATGIATVMLEDTLLHGLAGQQAGGSSSLCGAAVCLDSAPAEQVSLCCGVLAAGWGWVGVWGSPELNRS